MSASRKVYPMIVSLDAGAANWDERGLDNDSGDRSSWIGWNCAKKRIGQLCHFGDGTISGWWNRNFGCPARARKSRADRVFTLDTTKNPANATGSVLWSLGSLYRSGSWWNSNCSHRSRSFSCCQTLPRRGRPNQKDRASAFEKKNYRKKRIKSSMVVSVRSERTPKNWVKKNEKSWELSLNMLLVPGKPMIFEKNSLPSMIWTYPRNKPNQKFRIGSCKWKKAAYCVSMTSFVCFVMGGRRSPTFLSTEKIAVSWKVRFHQQGQSHPATLPWYFQSLSLVPAYLSWSLWLPPFCCYHHICLIHGNSLRACFCIICWNQE